MSFKNLKIIGERINPGFKSSLKLIEDQDIAGIQQLAVRQVENGATYININVGNGVIEDQGFMKDVIRGVQEVVAVPLSFDFPNVEVQKVFLNCYDQKKAMGGKPIVNSISELRMEMMQLYEIRDFKMILMASERKENGVMSPNKTADEVLETTLRMVENIRKAYPAITLSDIFIDVSVSPIGADVEGLVKMAIESIRKIGTHSELETIHMSVGLSNISVMLPNTALDGSNLKLGLESAFLTETVPYGLDTILATPGRKYQMLDEDNFVLKGFRNAINAEGYDSLMEIQSLYI
jgi:5-methyltetrahydrofolate--homocysteine methyltransferase